MIDSVVISAGGKGTRLASINPNCPKALTKVLGKMIIIDQLDKFLKQGVSNFYILLGFKAEQIKQVILDYSKNHPDIKIEFFIESEPLGSGGGLLRYKEYLPEIFYFIYCDIFFDINLNGFSKTFISSGADVGIVVHPNDHPYDSDLVVLFENGNVKEIKPHPHFEKTFSGNIVNAAFYIINKSVLPFENLFTSHVDFAQDLLPYILSKNFHIMSYRTVEFLKDMGTPDRLKKVEASYAFRHVSGDKSPVVYLDRDGTINKINLGEYITKPEQIELLDGVAKAIRIIRKKGYFCVCITNQPIIARGEIDCQKLKDINNRLEYLLGKQEAYLDGIYFCPHHPHSGFDGEIVDLKKICNCRKPATGLFEESRKLIEPDITKSWMVGDSNTDIEAGKAFGIKTALISEPSFDQQNNLDKTEKFDLKFSSLLDFAIQLSPVYQK